MKNNTLNARLVRYRQIKLSVTGRNSGKTISMQTAFWERRPGWAIRVPAKSTGTSWVRGQRKLVFKPSTKETSSIRLDRSSPVL